MSFEALGLRAELLRSLKERSYLKPTPIQEQAIPEILSGKDLLAGARTGTGKTAGFALPMLQLLSDAHIAGKKKKRKIRALVLVPTRELAVQVRESMCNYSQYLPLKSMAVFGGVNMHSQTTRLRGGVDILVATPGRLLDHINQQNVDLSRVQMLVLDEADRMLDMGFIDDIKKLQDQMPKEKQTLMFSATFSKDIKQLANKMLSEPQLIETQEHNSAVESVKQLVHPVDRKNKPALLSYMIGKHNMQQVLIFTRTKRAADRLSERLDKDGIRAAAIHGDKSQGARSKALADFKKGKVRALVATDIAARGLDIRQLPHVINFELPNTAEDYVHRIGRTGRAGHEGEARSLVCIDERGLLKGIERLIKRKLPENLVEGYEPDPTIKAEPVRAQKKSKGPKKAFKKSTGKPSASARPGSKPNSKKRSSRKKTAAGNKGGFAPVRRSRGSSAQA